MKKKFKFGVIGAGFMSSAIINGVLGAKMLSPDDIIVSDISVEKLNEMSSKGIFTTQDNKYLADNSEFVLFAVKPQNFSTVAESVNKTLCCKMISIMAGVKKDKIKSYFSNARVARCMPNTPCSIGEGAVGIDLSDFSEEKDIAFIKNIFSSLASVCVVDESLLNVVTGISGSAPAYFYLFLQGIINAGVEKGLDYDIAVQLATNTMIGAGKMVFENKDKSLDELINAVCSKGGTTIEAVNVFKDCMLGDITNKAVNACIKRSVELENL